jgi:hypothetical protein
MVLTFGCHGQQIILTTLTPGSYGAAPSPRGRGRHVCRWHIAALARLLPPGEGGMLPSGRYADARRADEGDPRKVSTIGQGWRRSNLLPGGEGGILPGGIHAGARRAGEGDLLAALV